MESNIIATLWDYEDERRSIGANVITMLAWVHAIDLEVCVYVVLVNTVIDDVAIVSAVAVPKGDGHSMDELRQSIK